MNTLDNNILNNDDEMLSNNKIYWITIDQE